MFFRRKRESQLLNKKSSFRFLKNIFKLGSLSLFLYFLHSQMPFVNTYSFECVQNERNNYLVNQLLPIDYRPTFYLPTCLAQMIFNEIKSHPVVKYKREPLETHDQGMISLDWLENEHSDQKKSKLLVILHGLTGGSESSYIKEIAETFGKKPEFQVVVVNYRGINNTPLLTPNIYHAGYYEDIYTAMKYLKSKYQHLRCYTIGTSMGANCFTKLFANHDDFNEWVKGFVSVSNPLNNHEVERRNRDGILDYFLIKRQKNYVIKHKDVLKDVIGKNFFIFRNRRNF